MRKYGLVVFMTGLILAILPACREEPRRDSSQWVQALYGFDKNHELVKGKTNDEIVAWLRTMGFNAVFGSYRDKNFVQALHQAGIKVFAEIGIFVGDRYWEKYPESRPVDAQGKPIEKDEWYAGVNPAVEAVRKDRLNAFDELLAETEVDGIWLDFIRWPCHWESPHPPLDQTSFDAPTVDRFLSETGITLNPGSLTVRTRAQEILANHQESWTRWKCDVITSFVEECRRRLENSGRDVILGMFTIPWRDTDHGGAIFEIMGQDHQALGRYVDVFSPMVYHIMCGQPAAWIAHVTDWTAERTNRPVWPIIQVLDEENPESLDEFKNGLQAAGSASGSSGVILFTMKRLTAQKAEVARAFYSSTEKSR